MTLASHPRLYIGSPEIEQVRRPPTTAFLRSADRAVSRAASQYLASPEFEYDHTTHNAHLIRARIMQKRVVTLIARYCQTREPMYRDAVVRHVRAMGEWEYWSWITWRQNDPRPDAIFDLSYGENSATLALAYDLLYADLTPDERGLFERIAEERAFKSFRVHACGDKKMWWFGKADCNWNTVCAGGAGMLALAMHESVPDASRLIDAVEQSVEPFMRRLEQTDGAWEEGLGYWNYGMRYAFTYLLSRERATGRAHPLIEMPATRKTLSFPIDFSPHGVSAGFGDSNGWAPMPFHFAAARRLRAPQVVDALVPNLRQATEDSEDWPQQAELLFLYPRQHRPGAAAASRNLVKLYAGQDWALMADRWPRPRLYCSIRGGTTQVPHAQRDLMSFNVVVGDEALILNPQSGAYLDTTFSDRRDELYEISPASKNTILINGVGIAPGTSVRTEQVSIGGLTGIRVDGAEAMGRTHDGQTPRVCGRLFLMLDGKALLVVDRVETPKPALVESRIHTAARVSRSRSGAQLRGARHALRVAYASTWPARCVGAVDPLTWPVRPTAMVRWITQTLTQGVTFATLFVPGAGTATVRIREEAGGKLAVAAAAGRWNREVVVGADLRGV